MHHPHALPGMAGPEQVMPVDPRIGFVGTPERVSETSRLTREQVVNRILSLNPSADAEFFDPFDDPQLDSYLRRLEAIQEPRGRRAVWVRATTAPGISSRRRSA